MDVRQKYAVPADKQNEKISKNSNTRPCKYVGVRQRPSGKWVAEIKDTTRKIRMWLGTFQTPEEAARAYDEAACLLRGSNTRTNFSTHVSANSHLSLKIKKLLAQKQSSKHCVTPTKTDVKSSNTAPTDRASIATASVYNRCIPTVGGVKQGTLTGDDGAYYRPDLSSCSNNVGELVDESWRIQTGGFDDGRVPYSEGLGGSDQDDHISASLYNMNGANEYLEINGYDPTDPLWDLPTLCHLFCAT